MKSKSKHSTSRIKPDNPPTAVIYQPSLPSDNPLRWTGGGLEIICGEKPGVASLIGIRSTSGRDWLKYPSEAEWWKIYLRGPDGTSPVYSNTYADYRGAELERISGGPGVLRMRWSLRLTQKQPAIVEVAISECPESHAALWDFSAQLPVGWRAARLDFPIISISKPAARMQMAAPVGYGHEYDLAPGEIYEGKYPSWSAVMQFIAFYGGGEGLYLAAHDRGGNLKDFGMSASAANCEFKMIHWVSASEPENGCFKLPYSFAMAGYEGGYMEAAQIYRTFSLTTPWGAAGRVHERAVPKWLLETDLWLRPDGAPADNLELARKGIEYFGPGVGMHWYRWHKIPYDTLYPEYLPALDGMAEAVAALQKEGAHVVPYINARLWDPQSQSWIKKNASDAAARKEDGSCYTELYGSRTPNNVMCPSTKLWQDTIANLVRRLLKEFGVNGVYLDQIAASAGAPCYNASHNHAPGGGCFWVDGYRALLKKARAKLSPEHILISEENAECWMDQIDVHLVVNTPWDHRAIPLFPAVYSDRTLLIAYQYYAPNEPKNSLPFRLKNARAFLWGAQVGWIQPRRILAEGVETEAAFLRNLATARRLARPYLNGGRFLGVCETAGDNSRLANRASGPFGGHYEINEPAVQASAWESPDGRCALLAVNLSDKSIAAKIIPPLHSKAAGKSAKGKPASSGVSLRLPPRGACVIELHD